MFEIFTVYPKAVQAMRNDVAKKRPKIVFNRTLNLSSIVPTISDCLLGKWNSEGVSDSDQVRFKLIFSVMIATSN